jgi:hypothetical protein
MSFWLLSGVLTALVTSLIATPLHQEAPILGALLILLIPLCAAGLYLLSGNPTLAN